MSAIEFADREERPAYVRFERRPIEDKAASLAAGRSVSKDVDFALVTPPYSKDCVEFKVETWLRNMESNVRNKRIPEKWMDHWKKSLEAWRNGQEEPLNGIPLKDSTAWSPAEIKNFLAAGFRVVEDIADANDEGLKRLGMGGQAHKNKAISIIQAAKDHGPLIQQVSALEKENSQLKGSVEALQEQVQRLLEQAKSVDVSRETFQEPGISVSDIIDEPIVESTLEQQYEAKFGKKPHHKMKEENIRKALES